MSVAEDESSEEVHVPGEIDWQMLDKSKFFFLGAALFSGVSAKFISWLVFWFVLKLVFIIGSAIDRLCG